MGDCDGGRKSTQKHQKVRFNSACNETHLVEREVSATSSSSSDSSSPESTITDNDLTNLDVSLDLSPHSPEIPGYDPTRIPSSVFSAGSTNDWSVASNESLFSITMGNNSFSRDHGFLMYQSGELMKLDEVFNLPITFPPVTEGEAVQSESEDIKGSAEPPPKAEDVAVVSANAAESGDVSLKNNVEIRNLAFPDQSPKDVKFEDHWKAKMPPDDLKGSARVSTQSDGSATSNSSFAFPILISQDAKPASTKLDQSVKDPPRPHPASPSKPRRSSPPPPKTRTLTSWFCCFSCCSFRCSLSLK